MMSGVLLSRLAAGLLAAVTMIGPVGCKDQSADANGVQKATNAPAANTPAGPAARAETGFDAARAFEHVKKQVAFGPRPSGSPALAETRKYLMAELTSYGLQVREDRFTAETPAGKVEMSNVIGELPGASTDVLILASHYDTKRMENFVGANDAGSSTGVLLEIARVVAEQAKAKKPDLTIWFVFFDGEEAVVEWTEEDSVYGSRHMVASLDDADKLEMVRGVVLLDMIGDKDLNILRELNSTKSMVEIIWSAAASLGYSAHFSAPPTYIDDDHVPFLMEGIPAVDLIDFSFGADSNYGPGGPANAYWHTTRDTLDKISAESLKIVGDTVIVALPKLIAHLKR